MHTHTYTQTLMHTQHWILAQMAPNGLLIKGMMSCLWWRLCVPLPVIHFLSSCPYWHKAERKKEQNKDWKKESVWVDIYFFYPFVYPPPSNILSAIKKSPWVAKCAKIKIAPESWLFKHLISKSADIFHWMQFTYCFTEVIILFCVSSILEKFVLDSCLFLGSRDHRQFVCLSLSWQELVLLVCKWRGCRTSLWNLLCVCMCVCQTQCF